MAVKTVLISGAGIAGPTLAYWLLQYGFEPTIIERAPSFREGGYVIDFWGLGYDVAEKMNLITQLGCRGYKADQLRLVNRSGRKVGGFSTEIFQSSLGNRFLSILRGDLAAVIYETVAGKVETIFGESIKSIEEYEQGVEVLFRNQSKRRFDLVVGADGLHSVVRSLTFGSESQFEKNLGYFAASFTTDNYDPRDEGVYVCYSSPGKQIARFALRNNRTVFFLIFAARDRLGDNSNDGQLYTAKLDAVFGSDGWECKSILHAMHSCNDLYFDSVSQIRMPTWSKGRIALVGDAAYCPSLLAGQGSALAMAGSYILAGELKKANGDHVVAFKSYEEQFKSFIAQKQKAAERFGAGFAPETAFAIFTRNQITRLFSIPFIANKFVRDSIADRLSLSDYA